ncbi:MAG: PAS domain-containing protein, partial [Desulfosarcinaceae bacterium]
MHTDQDKSKTALIEELHRLREAHEALKQDAAAQAASFESACQTRSETEEALALAKVIIDRSPVILFRREARDANRLVYISDNFRQLGYDPEDFLSGGTHFKEIVHPDDGERVVEELMAYAEQDVEEYTQVYRVLDASGQ